MHTRSRTIFIGVAFFVSVVVFMAIGEPTVTGAQVDLAPTPESCTQLLTNVDQHLAVGCRTMDRDEVCYGNRNIKVDYTDAANGQETLVKEGDIAPLNTVKSLTAGPLNPDQGEWGIAVIKAQPSNLEGIASGQVVTFIVYGDTTITGRTVPVGKEGQPQTAATCTGTTNRATYLRAQPGPNEQQVQVLQPGTAATFSGRSVDGQWLYADVQGQKGWLFTKILNLDCDPSALAVSDPKVETLPNVNAFYFTTGVGAQSSCKDIPPAGLFVQSPKGAKVTFRLNGADIVMGSTGIFTFNPGPPPHINIWTIDGEIDVIVGGIPLRVPAGSARTFPLGGSDGLQFIGQPGVLKPIYLADPLAPGYVLTLCSVARSAGLTVVGCNIVPPPPPRIQQPQTTEEPTTCTQRTFLSGGRVCIPGVGIFACDRNGKCDDPKNGESSYTCPEDCGPPPPPQGWFQQPGAPRAPATQCSFRLC